ncbi:cell division protein ZipA [Halomonas sp. M20]|uniref:cell division protein ZipA n=1 Tax=Halomonas sp. M20 TaxID=2763264 RepID=UPI001D0B054F|nr:cell division protein ZipA [Halomonas sp. M20]
MELREWLIILGLVLVTIIVVDGVRRLQRQRKVPRLDHGQRHEPQDDSGVGVDSAAVANPDPEAAAREAEANWELPNGGARVIKPAAQPTVAPKPKLQRQEHPGPSKVFSRMAQEQDATTAASSRASVKSASTKNTPVTNTAFKEEQRSPEPAAPSQAAFRPEAESSADNKDHLSLKGRDDAQRPPRQNQTSSSSSAYQTLSAVDEGDEQSAFSRTGMAAALRSGGQRVSQSMQRMSSAFQRQDESSTPHREPSLGNTEGFSEDAPERFKEERGDTPQPQYDAQHQAHIDSAPVTDEVAQDQAVDAQPEDAPPLSLQEEERAASHPVVEKAQRHHVSAERARETLAHAEEIIVISVMARTEEGFAGANLLNLMLACGLRYSEMGIFLRYETEEAESELQFAMVDVVKPGTFDLENMDDFSTPGVTFLMPLPGATDASAAFEAMVETAMVLVRNLGGELKDENRSVMTAQTVEFARQRVQEFGRRHRLHRYQAN